MSDAPAPLEGLRVLDVSTILAGPLCCQILGDYGADVVKIEHPRGGDNMRGHGRSKDGVPLWWKEIGRNKRTVALDLKAPRGGEVFRRLAATADVVVENFRPGTLERWGIGPDVLMAENPGLVVARLTGFGQTGPYSSRAGFGTLAEAMSGFAAATGEADGPPTLPAFGLADSICGIAASSAVLMALRHRDATGRGQVVDLSILEPLMTAVGPGPTVYQQLGEVAQRHGNRSTNNAPRNAYRTSDDKWVAISTSAQRIAERVMELVGHPEVIDEPWFATGAGRAEHVDLLDDHVGSWIAARDRESVLTAFTEAGAAIAPVYDARDLTEDPHVRETQMLVEVDDVDLGPVLQHNVMWRMSESPGRIRFTGRDIGQDTDEVLSELGYAAEDITALKDEEVVR
ncbi:CaiB/BaiF CoA transferase family protein [Nocardioides lianchengensis]|uniref:Crotonobetainyl-CoA:carnitine CoA-transferase CaiB n=1 Tax=Nocardioides lianchengensis TaxID=1045774 RepID=A0A1G7A957_9ACTN|nr:CoA transferase [Nocardioides lianchengensis]NYG13691.1 crotonobetainyl-CoA:carnitine CoA-transferase CaiB-like acyl-CoA transferase [Nocardioides lianchengensis]SDE10575.1 Crotonobetainyl-CoA:carnitine CoA-transferase CaiB [Nocardioides lianchengensis]